IVSNTVRVIVTGVLQHYVGEPAIQGVWHEVLGYLVILVGFGLIVGVSQRLALARPAAEPAAVAPAATTGGPGWWAVALLVPAAAACLWAEQFRQGHRDLIDLAAVAATVPGWERTDRQVPPDVAEMLK